MIQVTFPFAQFTDKAGQPLDAGFIYIGTENLNPETNPIALFWDDALTIPAAQPLRTINGYLARNGSPGRVYTNTSTYSITVRDKSSNLVATALDASALQTEASLVAYMPAGAGSIATTVQAKLREFVSVKDKGAIVNGIADDTAAIAAARAVVEGSGGSVYYGGKTAASGFWENLAPLAQEWVRGSATAYATDLSASKPLIGLKLFNGTPTVGAGYAAYGSRYDAYTKPGVDVSSTVTAMFAMQSYSTNSVGNNFNATNQVALVANSSAMDANASASVEAINAIAVSAYTGALPHMVAGVEADVAVSRPAGWFGESNKTYSVGFSAVLSDVTTGHGTMAFSAGSNSGVSTWLHGLVTAGTGYTGVTVARDGAKSPQTGVWVSSAVNYGIYVGASPLYQLNPGSLGDFAYKPAIGIALGQEGATTANSHKLRFISTNGGVAAHADLYTDPGGSLFMDFNGTSKARISAFDGSYWVQGAQVVGPRNTGWGTNSGVTSKAGFDSATVTLPVLAQTVSALQQAAKNHGLIGA